MAEKENGTKGAMQRIGDNFKKEIDNINKERIKRGIDKRNKSVRKITDLITRHNSWPIIKEEIINLDMREQFFIGGANV